MLLLGGELNATLEQIRDGTIGPDGRRVEPDQQGPRKAPEATTAATEAETEMASEGDGATGDEDGMVAEDREER